MKDFGYALQQIGQNNLLATGGSSLIRYFKLEGSAFVPEPDSGPYNRQGQGSWSGFNASAPGLPAPGYLLDQHVPTLGACFQAGHGFNNLWAWNGKQDGVSPFIDDFTNRSWSLVFAGLKPHDMSVDRTWHGIGSGSDIGGTVMIKTDGTLTVTSNVANPASSASGVIHQYVPHLIIISYDKPSTKITVYVGDWTGRFITAINAAAGADITTSSPFPLVGRSRNGTNAADGFLDDYAVFAGHAVTAAEAATLFDQTGYGESSLTYPTSPGHRAAPFNRAYPNSQPLDATSVAAVTEFAGKADATKTNGAGSFNWNQFTTSIYIVSKAFRQNPANWMKLAGPTHYGDQTQVMSYEDAPVPYSGRPSLGFTPSNGSDAHAAIWCPETDEYWDIGVMGNVGTDAAPSWTFVYGNKQTHFSLFIGAYPGGQGATATGLPNMFGVPTIAELQNAIYNGVPIPHGLAAIMFDGLATQVWPANRHDGSKASGSSVIEGQTYRLKHDGSTTAAIAAMPHPTGRAMAQAAQTYGIVIVDRNVFATLLETEDYHQYLAVNGFNAYGTDPGGQPVLGGLLNGQPFSVNTMQGMPWPNLELLDNRAMNPSDVTQPLRPTVNGISGQHLPGSITLTWPDDPLTVFWNVYQKSGTVALTSALSTGAPLTSMPVAALSRAIPVGSQITTVSGANVQTFTTSAPATANATSIPIVSETPTFAFPTNSVVAVRSLAARTFWPQYTVWNPASTITFAITAVNGGGENGLSFDFTPPLPIHTRRGTRGFLS